MELNLFFNRKKIFIMYAFNSSFGLVIYDISNVNDLSFKILMKGFLESSSDAIISRQCQLH